MTSEIRASDLFKACHVLFGKQPGFSTQFLNQSLQMSGLKAAYRKRARETHPDLARSLDVESHVLEEQFKQVQSAFEQLRLYLENPSRYRVIGGDRKPPASSVTTETVSKRRRAAYRTESPEDPVHAGPIPASPLLFGRYLYYAGAISYRTLIDALVWQKRERPLIGKIALQWGWLNGEDILGILKLRTSGERFGECAVRRGFIDSGQLRLLVVRQKMLQPRLGDFFVAKGILTARQVARLEKAHRLHNWECRRTANRHS
jgi:hypothetical protein